MREEIIAAISSAVTEPDSSIGEDSRISDITLDSIDVVEIIAVLSTRFGVELDPSQMDEIETVGHVVDYVIKNQGQLKHRNSLKRF
jgi:acyl carrier protein